MKIECSQDKIKRAVSLAEKISGKNMTLPVLSCLLLDSSKTKNTLTIKSTNIDLGIEILIPAKVEEEGMVAVPSQILNSFLGSLMDEETNIKLVTDQNNLKIITMRSSGVIKTMLADDFPTIPQLPSENSFTLNANEFTKGLKSVWYSSSISSIKPELSSVCVFCDEEFVFFVATDSFRLAEKKIKIKKSKDFGQILIPYKNIPDIIRTLEGIDDEIEVSLDKNQISFKYSGIYLISRVVDGTFPDYKQIIPKTSTTEITVLKQDLINTLKLSNVFSDKFNQINLKIDSVSKKCEIRTKNNDIGENVSNIDCVIKGDSVEINFNYKYIIDCFQSIDSDSVTIYFNGLNKPIVIIPVSDTSFRYLVMPMNR